MAPTKTLAEMEQSVPESEARKRLAALFDEDSFNELDKFMSANGELCSVISGSGTVYGTNVFAFAQDVSVKSGALGKAAAEKIRRTYELAAKCGAPVIGFFDSKGADINEGMDVLSSYGAIMRASAEVSGVVPQIAVITGLCAGCAAMIAQMADIVVMTEDAELFMTAPFNTPDGKLEGAGKAENAAKSGVADIIAKDAREAAETAKALVAMLPQNNLSQGFVEGGDESGAAVSASLKGKQLVEAIADKSSVIELGERFGKAAYTALASVNCAAAAFVTTGGADRLSPDDAAKIARFVQFADVFSIPVVTLIDTEGFEGSSAAELAGSVRECAKLAQVYASATTVKVNVIAGKAFGAAYAAFDSADYACAWEGAQIAPMTPEAGKAFMGEELTTDPFTAAARGMIDGVIAPANTREAVSAALDMLSSKRVKSPGRKHANFTF